MPSPTNHQTPPPASSPSSSPGPIAQQLVQLQGGRQTPPNPSQPTTIPGKALGKKRNIDRKEMREWLNIVGILLIPLLIGVYTIVNNTQQTDLAQQNRQADVTNQLDQQRETALKTYEDDITSLLLDRHLATSQPGDEVRTVALTKTLEVLHQLDGPRNVRAIQFLQNAQLIGTDFTAKTPRTHNIIDFSSADLANDDLRGANLSEANLGKANLGKANLYQANLSEATLTKADLSGANLTEANLNKADLSGANLTVAFLSGAFLSGANLNRAFLSGADLTVAFLSGADLTRATLNGANLFQANLTGADLTGADLTGADLTGTDLSGATMPNRTRHSCQQDEEFFCK